MVALANADTVEVWSTQIDTDLLAPTLSMSIPDARLFPAAAGVLPVLAADALTLFPAGTTLAMPHHPSMPLPGVVGGGWLSGSLVLGSRCGSLFSIDPRAPQSAAALPPTAIMDSTRWSAFVTSPTDGGDGAPPLCYAAGRDALAVIDLRFASQPLAFLGAEQLAALFPDSSPALDKTGEPWLVAGPRGLFALGGSQPGVAILSLDAQQQTENTTATNSKVDVLFRHSGHDAEAGVLGGLWHPTRPDMLFTADTGGNVHAWAPEALAGRFAQNTN